MTTTEARAELVKIARKYVGTVEVGGNNRGPMVEAFQRATRLSGTGWPWCAAFVCYVLREWLQVAGVRPLLGITDAAGAERWRPKTASAFAFEEWAIAHGLTVHPETAAIYPGDIITFDMSHIGIASEVGTSTKFQSVEGNTGPTGGRDGDGVWEKVRERPLARRIIRLFPA